MTEFIHSADYSRLASDFIYSDGREGVSEFIIHIPHLGTIASLSINYRGIIDLKKSFIAIVYPETKSKCTLCDSHDTPDYYTFNVHEGWGDEVEKIKPECRECRDKVR